MSVVLTMTTGAILAGLTLSELSIATIISKGIESVDNKGLETVYNDVDMMIRTLQDMDCHFRIISRNKIFVKTASGEIRFERHNETENFRMMLDDIQDVQGLINNIKSFEVDYGRNVQDFTYNHIKENLADDMTIVSEEIDGDDIYLTININ